MRPLIYWYDNRCCIISKQNYCLRIVNHFKPYSAVIINQLIINSSSLLIRKKKVPWTIRLLYRGTPPSSVKSSNEVSDGKPFFKIHESTLIRVEGSVIFVFKLSANSLFIWMKSIFGIVIESKSILVYRLMSVKDSFYFYFFYFFFICVIS